MNSAPSAGVRGNRRASGPSEFLPAYPVNLAFQSRYLSSLADDELPKLEMSHEERKSKEAFRQRVEYICRSAVFHGDDPRSRLNLVPFGSFASGFGVPNSDMDLALMSESLPANGPRMMERALLDQGIGARLLTRTRVPILKVCEKPSAELYEALSAERARWDQMSHEEKMEHDRGPKKKEPDKTIPPEASSADQPVPDSTKPQPNADNKPARYSTVESGATERRQSLTVPASKKEPVVPKGQGRQSKDVSGEFQSSSSNATMHSETGEVTGNAVYSEKKPTPIEHEDPNPSATVSVECLQYIQRLKDIQTSQPQNLTTWIAENPPPRDVNVNAVLYPQQAEKVQKKEKPWLREKPLGALDFPKQSSGILCDINFSNPLGIHNTALLHAYSVCDPRVRSMVLFVKLWAGRRKINSGYNGTLSSYGYVLMVLHFLVNVASPPVCPNLQLWITQQLETTRAWPTRRTYIIPDPTDPLQVCQDMDIRFNRNEKELADLASRHLLSRNTKPLGRLLRDFFFYFGARGINAPNGGFNWTKDVLSLRTPRGLISKVDKGWTGARTTEEEGGKEVRHRYLFAVEDPFEISHNVARTVTHHGICAIRDELRRAVRILEFYGRGLAGVEPIEGGLLEVLTIDAPPEEDEKESQSTKAIPNESTEKKLAELAIKE